MYHKSDVFLNDEKEMDKEQKRNAIHQMIDILNTDQLSEVINFLEKPRFTLKLNEYLLDSKLPDAASVEYRFLVQAATYNGNIVRKLMNKEGISNYYLDKFIHKYELREISKSSYVFPNKTIDAPFLFQAQYTRAVISHESALYMLDLSDVIPQKTIMSMPKNYKLSQLEKNANQYIKVYDDVYNNNKALVLSYYENDPILLVRNSPIGSTQIVTRNTMNNNLVSVTSEERTISDILAPNSKTEEEIKEEALKKYFDLHDRNSTRLRRIAYQQNVLEELDNYLWKLHLN